MSGGGGKTTQTTTEQRDPWSQALPYLTDALSGLQSAYSKQPSYYGGNLTVGPTSAENAAWGKINNFNSSYFGNGGQYDKSLAAMNTDLAGGEGAQGYANLNASGPYQFQNPFGTAGGLDARNAISSALSGTPDYAGLQASIQAAQAPVLRDFNQNILPGLNSRATFLNSSTGGIKSLGNILPDLGGRLGEIATQATEGERQRALAAQQNAAGLVSQGGITMNQLGLQSNNDWLSALGNFAGLANNARATGLGAAPGMFSIGQVPGQTAAAYANWDRGLKEQALAADQAKFNYLRDAPMQWASGYSSSVLPYAGVGGTGTSTTTAQKSANPMGFGDILSGGLGLTSLFGGLQGLGAFGGGGGKGGGSPVIAPGYSGQ